MEIKKLLPIGSIVLLKGGKKRLMVCGVKQNEAEGEKCYDYLGFLYPEGHVGEKYQYLFNHENIEEIIFRGYEDEERAIFLEKLSAYYGE